MRVGKAIMGALHMNRDALLVAVAHGQVKADGVALARADLNRDVEEFRGQMISCYKREMVMGSRLAIANEQLEIG
jgi:hypothetical protein